MILKVKCLGCGKKGEVLILFRRIFSRKWQYFGNLRLTITKGKIIEYWECRECRKR